VPSIRVGGSSDEWEKGEGSYSTVPVSQSGNDEVRTEAPGRARNVEDGPEVTE
jgi:hypothetical protein